MACVCDMLIRTYVCACVLLFVRVQITYTTLIGMIALYTSLLFLIPQLSSVHLCISKSLHLFLLLCSKRSVSDTSFSCLRSLTFQHCTIVIINMCHVYNHASQQLTHRDTYIFTIKLAASSCQYAFIEGTCSVTSYCNVCDRLLAGSTA